MTVMDYCLETQRIVEAARPDRASPLFDAWFADSGRASRAVGAAIEGRNAAALDLAEPLSERYTGGGNA
jgi:hypothetical protein